MQVVAEMGIKDRVDGVYLRAVMLLKSILLKYLVCARVMGEG